MSPENVTGYSCKRSTPHGPCLTAYSHPCQDVRPTTVQVRTPLSEAKWFTPVLRTKEGFDDLQKGVTSPQEDVRQNSLEQDQPKEA